MFSAIRRRMTFANVTVTLALVFAMSGGALAAKHYIITSTNQIKPSVLKALTGKAGPAGTPGAQGLQGPQGLPGQNGKEGAAGKEGSPGPQGAKGANGTNGVTGPAGGNGAAGATGPAGAKGADGATGPAGPTGPEGSGGGGGGGATGPTGPMGLRGVTGAAGPEGPIGPAGPTGPAGTYPETLPSGKTETGQWSISTTTEEGYVAISFPIAVPAASEEAFFYNQKQTEEIKRGEKNTGPEQCKGSLVKPTAPPGKLCVYTFENSPSLEFLIFNRFEGEGYGLSGSSIFFIKEGSQPLIGYGDWAVTAP